MTYRQTLVKIETPRDAGGTQSVRNDWYVRRARRRSLDWPRQADRDYIA
jgi:hypothetical protein